MLNSVIFQSGTHIISSINRVWCILFCVNDIYVCSILYDAGEYSWNSKVNGIKVASEIRRILNSSHVDVGVLSHLHSDHLGYVGYGGFWHLMNTEGIQFGKFIDRNAGIWTNASMDVNATCGQDQDITWYNAG